MSSPDLQLVEVYRATNSPEAQTICCALQDAGVLAQIEGEMLQGVIGAVPTGWNTGPRLMVPESQFALARKVLLQAAEERRQTSSEATDETTRCLACGSKMAESQAQCANCGWSYEK